MSTAAGVATTATSTAPAEQVRGHGHRHGGHQMKEVVQAVADRLGMSAEDLRAATKAGRSLADVASEKGVSRDDLVTTVASALDGARPPGASRIDATELAGRLVDRTRGERSERAEADHDGDDLAKRAMAMLGAAASGDPAGLQQALRSAPPDIQSLLRAGLQFNATA